MPTRVLFRLISAALCLGASAIPPARAQSFSPAAVEMFHGLRQQPNDLARYVYLVKTAQELPAADRPLAMQMFASVENELGLYNEALRDFPLKSHVAADIALPTPARWEAADAVDVIARQAADRRIVLINEAHHDAHTRQLTLALLPRLRELGFDHFAAEALLDKDASLMNRGYATANSGSEYLREPSYGEIIRTAIRLGFKVVSYDVDSRSTQERESGQASNLYRKVFARNPDARLFVHAGYAHIDKAKGRLGSTAPMAMQLQQLTDIEPLSIDQTQFREQIPARSGDYRQLVTDFPLDGPTVLINRETGKPWSAQPDKYDLNVLLPPAGAGVIESGLSRSPTTVHDADLDHLMLPQHIRKQRPNWLTQRTGRVPYGISTTLCKTTFPCVVDAHYVDEPDDAIAVDRYAFMRGNVETRLYLRPGGYRLRASDARGHTLYEGIIQVEPH